MELTSVFPPTATSLCSQCPSPLRHLKRLCRSPTVGFCLTVVDTSRMSSSLGGNIDNGHWARFHRFFSDAAWDLDVVSMHLAKLVWTIPCSGERLCSGPSMTHSCRKRGLTVYERACIHDPLISSRALKLVSWGHDWVVLCLLVSSSLLGRRLKSMPCPLPCVFIATAKDLPKARKGKPRRPNASP